MATKSTSKKRASSGVKKKAKPKPAARKTAAKKAKSAPKSTAKKATKKAPDRKSAPKKAAPKKKAAAKAKTTKAAPARKTGKSKSGAKRPAPVRVKKVEKRFEHLRDALALKQSELMQAYAAAKNDTRDRMDDGTEDYIDYAVNSYAKDFLLSLTEMERQQLQLVREALHRLNRGEYGDCLQCGNEIPVKRLEVSPWVRYCVTCQELEDQGLLPEQSFAEFDDETAVDEDDLEEDVEDDDQDGDDEADDGDEDDDDDADGDDLELDDDED